MLMIWRMWLVEKRPPHRIVVCIATLNASSLAICASLVQLKACRIKCAYVGKSGGVPVCFLALS